MSTPSFDADVLIVGAGPAGVAAALMAASLKWKAVVVEPGQVGGKLHAVGPTENVPGNWSTGRQFAQALAVDLERLEKAGSCTVVRSRAVAVQGLDNWAELTLEDGNTLAAPAVVAACGSVALTPSDVDWLTAPDGFSPQPLWRTNPSDHAGRTYVLGADRALGTWLREHPESRGRLHVLCLPQDSYKTSEVTDDPRVRIVPVARVNVTHARFGNDWLLETEQRDGSTPVYAASTVLNNLGSKPAQLAGLLQGPDGYCPPERQHPRIRVVGDLRAQQFQRIVSASGSGADAVLSFYYESVRGGGALTQHQRHSQSRADPSACTARNPNTKG